NRTIYSLAPSDSAYISYSPSWCATSSTGKIAFTRQHIGSQLGLSELCTISPSGGTVTVLTSYRKLNAQGRAMSLFVSPPWSPDDSKIAIFRMDTVGHCTIMIFNASTGAALDSIPITLYTMYHLEWSRTGANLLAFSEITTSEGSAGPPHIYYCVPTTGSTPSTNSVAGNWPTWSPNNSSLMYIAPPNDVLMKVTAQTS